jgi:hypothetical protein
MAKFYFVCLMISSRKLEYKICEVCYIKLILIVYFANVYICLIHAIDNVHSTFLRANIKLP